MNCPECQEPLQPRQTSLAIALDVCPRCKSIWFDRGELLFFVKPVKAYSRAIAEARRRAMQSSYASPASGEPMVAVKTPGGGAPAYLDPDLGGIWLRGSTARALVAHKDLVIKPAPREGEVRRRDAGRRPPALWPRTLATLFGFYALLSLVLITASLFYGLPPHFALGIAVLVAGVQYAIGPFLMDLTLRWFYKVDWVDFESLPDHVQEFVRRTCSQHEMKLPSFGLIPDLSPNAFTYGHTPNNARLVLTAGMFELLEPNELEGVVGHEIGHARHWDMALMTLVQLVPLVLYYLYRTAISVDPDDSRAKAASTAVAVGAYVLYMLAEYFVLWFSRAREFHADRFGGLACGSPNALARALVKIAYGLAGRGEEEGGSGRAAAIGALGIFDAGAAQTLAVTSYGADPDEPVAEDDSGGDRYRLDPDAVKGAMKWDLWNPWARWYELNSTHPLVARRLLFLSELSMEVGEAPFVRFDLVQPESFWDEFLVDVFVKLLPFATFAAGLAAVALAGGGVASAQALGWTLVATGLASMLKLRFRYPNHGFPDMSVATLLEQVKVSDMRPVACRLEGRVRGRGVPGLIWSDDFVLQDETGILFLDHRQPLAIWEFLFGWLRARKLIGEEIVVEGWFRRSPVPYVEIARYTVAGRTRRSWARHPRWLLALLLIGLGVFLLVGAANLPVL